jgi:hypothetical protein
VPAASTIGVIARRNNPEDGRIQIEGVYGQSNDGNVWITERGRYSNVTLCKLTPCMIVRVTEYINDLFSHYPLLHLLRLYTLHHSDLIMSVPGNKRRAKHRSALHRCVRPVTRVHLTRTTLHPVASSLLQCVLVAGFKAAS